MFDDYSGSIQLFFVVLMELILISWIFGIDNLATLMEARTGEKMPAFVKIFIKYVIPAFIFVVFILAWINEFSA